MIRVAVIALAVLVFPAVAVAKPPPVSAVSQYVEDIPTASGPSFERGAPAPSGAILSTRSEQALARRGRKQAKQLKSVATSAQYGAPQSRLPKTGERLAVEQPGDARLPSAGELASVAAGESAGLILLLAGTALAVGAWALVRARR